MQQPFALMLATILSAGAPGSTFAQDAKSIANTSTIRCTTFDTVDGKVQEVPAVWTGMDAAGQVRSADVASIQLFTMRGLSFPPGEKPVFDAAPVSYDLRQPNITHAAHPNEFLVLFIASHGQRCLDIYRHLFDGRLKFEQQEKYRDIRIYLGNASYMSTPREFVLRPDCPISPTLVYHEMGHRAFWLLEDELGIPMGGPNNYIHMGLLEYFTASFANSPVVGEGFLAPFDNRRLDLPTTYPQGFVYLTETLKFIKDYLPSVGDKEPWHRAFLETYTKMPNLDKIKNGHQSGMMISHPLWNLRKVLGAQTTDKLVAQAILNLPHTILRRSNFLPKTVENVAKAAEWYDLVFSLLETDKTLNQGQHADLIRSTFKKTGFDLTWIKA